MLIAPRVGQLGRVINIVAANAARREQSTVVPSLAADGNKTHQLSLEHNKIYIKGENFSRALC